MRLDTYEMKEVRDSAFERQMVSMTMMLLLLPVLD
jgi:hypothetical protein